jgi:hypothetical protein
VSRGIFLLKREEEEPGTSYAHRSQREHHGMAEKGVIGKKQALNLMPYMFS